MKTIGLTGGIGAGKSTVGAAFARRGAIVVDADALAREAVAPGTPGLAQVVAEFGRDVLLPDGSLDRAAMAGLVFSDAAALARLNAIVHPRVAAASQALIEAADPDAVVVYDVPLLVENGLADGFDLVVVVEAPQDVRRARLLDRGMQGTDVDARMAVQATDEQRRAVADFVIDNGGDPAATEAQVAAVWQQLAP